jgi:hypothetical protein
MYSFKCNHQDIIKHLPANRGYIDGKGWKHYGDKPVVENGLNVVMITPTTVNSRSATAHVWSRRAFTKLALDTNITEYDCLTGDQHGSYITSRGMKPCQNEIANNGICSDRFNPNHKKFYYHFTKYRDGQSVRVFGSDDAVSKPRWKPLCKYHKSGDLICWEKQNGNHCSVFSHE